MSRRLGWAAQALVSQFIEHLSVHASLTKHALTGGSTGRRWAVAAYLAFLGLWLVCHPYKGMAGDAVLYTVQALHHLHPEHYAHDVFFWGESQDNYTVFSPIYAGLIDLLGLGRAAIALTLAGAALWCLAAWRFSRLWPDAKSRTLYLFLLAVMPIAVGGHGILSAAEPYPVPRLWSNALTLLACAFWVEKKIIAAAAAWIAAMLLHPLMALAGCGFALFHAFRWSRPWLFGMLAAVVAALALAALNVSLFGRLFQVMSPEWFDLVYQRTSLFMFPSRWGLADYGTLAFHFTVLVWAASIERNSPLGRIFAAAALTGLTGWLLSLLGGDWLRSVLILQVQPWRMLWLSDVVAWGATAFLALRLWLAARPLVLALALAWFTRESGGVALLWFTLLLWRWPEKLRPLHVALVESVLVLGLAAQVFWSWADFNLAMDAASGTNLEIGWEKLYHWFRLSLVPSDDPMLILLLAPLAFWLWWKSRPVALVLFLPVGLLLLSDWTSRLEAGRVMRPEILAAQQEGFWGSSPFNRLVPLGAEIYWPQGLELTWLGMGRSSYFSLHQSAGLAFSEAQAREVYRRYLAAKPLGGRDAYFKLLTLEESLRLRGEAIPLGTLDGLRRTCNADRRLDFVVLRNRYPQWVKASWYAPFLPGGAHLYSCSDFRND